MNLEKFWQWFTTDSSKQNAPTAPGHVVLPNQPTPTVQKKKLGFGVIMFILINSILGSSMFYLPGLGVRSSGAASLIAWAILFIVATITMLYIGELVTMLPTSGGTYEFCKRAYGRFGSFFSGWLIWLAGNCGMALALVAAAEYFIPESGEKALILRMIFVVIWLGILSYMAYRGIDAGSTMLVTFGVVSVVVVALLILPSFIDFPALLKGAFGSPFDKLLLTPFFRVETSSILPFLGLSLLFISEAFLGFEAVSYMANEAREPKKLHKAIIWSMVLCGVITLVYILSSLGTISYSDYVNDARPFAIQALNTLGQKGQDLVVFGMYLVIVGTAAAWPISGSRLLQAMASDKLFVKHLAVKHPVHGSAHRAIIFQTAMVFIFSWLLFRGYKVGWSDPYGTIYLIFVLLSLVVVTLIVLTVPILRRKEKDLERPFKAPLGTIGPIILALFFLALIANWVVLQTGLAFTIIKLAGSVALLGVPLYFLVEMFYDPQAIVRVNEKLSFLVVFVEKIFFPFSIRKTLLKDMGDMTGKVVLEYGCSVGTLTRKLAQRVGPTGRIFATDMSLHKVEVVHTRMKKFPFVKAFHHPHLDDFRLPLPGLVDGVLSVGQLSYMQNPGQILSSLGKHVKPGGEVVFLDYDKFFYFIPNVSWLEDDEELQKMFAAAGFAVEIERKNGLLWQYIIIYGVKT